MTGRSLRDGLSSRATEPLCVSSLRASIPSAGLSWGWRDQVVSLILDQQERENATRPEFTPAASREMVERAINGVFGIYDCRSSDFAAVYAWMSLWDALGVDFHASKMVFKPASAIEAAAADETGTGSAAGESAVPQADAQGLNP